MKVKTYPLTGRNVGWKIKVNDVMIEDKIQEVEQSSYRVGDSNLDVDENSFKGFKL